jgi:phthiocerol/phenolphthiocerol synthesis type-I polyketide synthase C
MSEPIAITGIGCRFPGGVDGVDTYWALLRQGVDAVTEVPACRWDADSLYHPDPDVPGTMYTRYGAFLSGIDEFDAQFFGISPREAVQMDPQQRLLLEVTWEALESAGEPPARLAGSQTGVFVGISTNDYASLRQGSLDNLDPYTGTGTALSVAAGRLSYVLGLHGPTLAVDTACSSSLVAVHLACQSLRSGECQVALAGGVNLILVPDTTVYLCRLRALAHNGRCKTFDAAADGYVRGEGCGMVVLKTLSAAMRNRDRIFGVIRGSAINHDGRSNGLTAPSGAAQEAVIRAALENARVRPGQVGFVEAHGTGTPLGDGIELEALSAVFGDDRPAHHHLVVGSVKTNVGHLEAAAGIAGLIKAILAIQHGEIPPNLHFARPNPHFSWTHQPIDVPRDPVAWRPDDSERIAGVSSFGISGTNAHVILADAPHRAAEEVPLVGAPILLPLSARHPNALRGFVHACRSRMPLITRSLFDVGYTAAVRRSHYEHRLAVLAHSADELDARLAAFLQGESAPDTWTGVSSPDERRKLVFVFHGQGGQWAGMGRELLDSEPVFRAAIQRCDESMREFADWSLHDVLAAGQWDRIETIQPAVFALQVALAALWRAWGIVPDAVVGHSMGEVAAAHVAGILSLRDAARIVCRRSALLRRLSGRGGMVMVELSIDEAHRRIAGSEQRVSVAVSNSPRSTVLSGDVTALETLVAALEHDGVYCRWVNVDVASHSPQVDTLRAELIDALQALEPQTANLPFYSTVTGLDAEGRDLDAGYWVRNLRQPVLFAGTVERLARDGHDIFVEVGPHPILGPALDDTLRGMGQEAVILPSLRREEPERGTLLRTLGALYAAGQPVAWERVYGEAGAIVPLPSYQWQRERFWIAPPTRRHARSAPHTHPFLATHIEPADAAGAHIWETPMGVDVFPYLTDHRLGQLPVFPAAAYGELALAAGAAVLGDSPFALEELTFHKLLILDEATPCTVQIGLSDASSGSARVRIASRRSSHDQWTIHATAIVRLLERDDGPGPLPTWDDVQMRCTEHVSGSEYYRGLAAQGLMYGPSFTGIADIWRRPGEALALLTPSEAIEDQAGSYQVHPAVLDMCFQALGAALRPGGDVPYLPVRVGRLRLWRQPQRDLRLYARLATDPPVDAPWVEGDLWLWDHEGPVLEARQFRVERVETLSKSRLDSWLHHIAWRHQTRTEATPSDRPAGTWLILGDPAGPGRMLRTRLDARGAECAMRNPVGDVSALLRDLYGKGRTPCRGIVWVCSEGDEDVPAAAFENSAGVVALVQALARTGWRDMPRLFLVTVGCQSVGVEADPPAVAHAALWGLGRTIAMEHPELACTCVDLSRGAPDAELDSLCDELLDPQTEGQVVLRGGDRYVARLTRDTPAERHVFPPAPEQPFRLETDRPGVLDHLTLRATRRRDPGAGEIEIRVSAAGLNFLDVLAAMGLRPDLPDGPIRLGGECSGTVVAIGEGVTRFQVGDEVMGLAPYCFGTFVTTRAEFVVPKPDVLTFADAATVPVAFLTAYYALHHVGRLQRDERVLIHSAAGGVGLAAIQVARWLGAEVFATAGSPDKRAFLRDLGVAHVMDSRSLEFVREVKERTGNEGVDVVLNSLTGAALEGSLEVLAPYGRFLEIGKKDVYEHHRLDLWPFHANLSYSMIDLARMLPERPALCSRLLNDVGQSFETGTFTALPRRVFPIAQAADAFREMAQARHIGKIVLSLDDRTDVRIAVASAPATRIHSSATYLVVGGLGGLGLAVARWMVGQGARHVVLTGRSGASSDASRIVDELRTAGTDVRVIQADVSDAHDVQRVLATIEADMPRLAGIVHAAGVLDDSTLLQLDPERLARVLAPKVAGAWNLHVATRHHALDFFVLFSSGSALLGSPGQGNYNAANAFLDALAHHRRSQGWAGLSIDWGPFADVGMVAGPEWTERLSSRGMGSLTSSQGTEALQRLIGHTLPQIAVLPLNVRQWRQVFPRFAQMPFFAELVESDAHAGGAGSGAELLIQQLAAADSRHRLVLLEQHLREQVASVLRLSTDRIGPRTPLQTLGLDSLMALELRNRLEDLLAVRLPATLVWQYPTLAVLAAHLSDLLDLSPASEVDETPIPGVEPIAPASAIDRIAQMSDEEVDRLLAEKIGGTAGVGTGTVQSTGAVPIRDSLPQ